MITIVERNGGWTIADDGQVLAHLSNAKAEQVNAALSEALRPVSTAITPAKYAARVRPPIQHYPVRTAE